MTKNAREDSCKRRDTSGRSLPDSLLLAAMSALSIT